MHGLHEEPQDMPIPEVLPAHEQPLLNNESARMNQNTTVKKKIMKTPCDHKFHINCLKKWMEIKLECPTCRKQLPSLE